MIPFFRSKSSFEFTCHAAGRTWFPFWIWNCKRPYKSIIDQTMERYFFVRYVVTHLYSSLKPYENITSGNCSKTALAHSFINSNAFLSFGFSNSCTSENLHDRTCYLKELWTLVYKLCFKTNLQKSRAWTRTMMMFGSMISSSTSNDFTYSYLLFAISLTCTL